MPIMDKWERSQVVAAVDAAGLAGFNQRFVKMQIERVRAGETLSRQEMVVIVNYILMQGGTFDGLTVKPTEADYQAKIESQEWLK